MSATSTAAALDARIAGLRTSPGFENYLYVRERVLEMRTQVDAAPDYKPSAYWKEELENFEYMLDASPLIIDKLRQHTFHVTGVRIHEYRSGRERQRERYADKLRALLAQGKPELFLPEAEDLGGFGFMADGHLINI